MIDTRPTVSVIIPTYNCAAYIAETINSVLNQTIKDLELIVVDDGSTDQTCDIVASYGSPVRLVTKTNGGVSTARNMGIRHALGQYICLMDHDDYWFPDKLELQLNEMTKHAEVGVVYSSFILWYRNKEGLFPDSNSFDRVTFSNDIDKEYSGWIYHLLLLDCWVLTSTAMFRREVFDRCGMFDELLPYSEDWELWLRISRDYPFIKLQKPSTLYRQHARQGNRIVRNIDYRTELISKAAEKWGLCSQDGRCLTKRQLKQQLARYHFLFGLHHLKAGNLGIANHAFFKAWLRDPLKLKSLACIPIALVGWKPK